MANIPILNSRNPFRLSSQVPGMFDNINGFAGTVIASLPPSGPSSTILKDGSTGPQGPTGAQGQPGPQGTPGQEAFIKPFVFVGN